MKMAYLFNPNKVVNDNIFKFEERLGSQYTRFLERAPSFVTYFNINNIESTVDSGLGNQERILGQNSPMKYKEIKQFPIYGLDQIVLDLQDTDQGLDTDYNGDAIILPNTVKPLPDDLFIIDHLDKSYIFRVTSVAYDTIKSNNFYKISFTLKSIDEESYQDLTGQVNKKYTCVFSNIGTKDKCLIEDDEMIMIGTLDNIYRSLAELYKMLFYDKKYNVFIYSNFDGFKMYDKFNTEFINRNKLFDQQNDFDSLYLNLEEVDNRFGLQYHKSFYRLVEDNKKTAVKQENFTLYPIQDAGSVFKYYRDTAVRSVIFGEYEYSYLPQPFIDSMFPEEGVVVEARPSISTIVKYFNKEIESIYDLDLESLLEYNDFMDYDYETFIMIPVLLYILRNRYNKFMATN